ncbi:hypothetical protein CLOM_g3302 [Closterium sp. NIES-68]|nr:hypothetical protein CLOM_g3302 [Closterium sp. NIES-68]GJP73098.1 hypothetical protein CLOP_g3845 [Closterium sp. NIES-67]
MESSKFYLLLVIVATASVLDASGQTEPFLVTKARQTRAAAINATNDSQKSDALAAQRAQELLAANKTLADATATYNDALPLVNRLKTVLAQKVTAKNQTATSILSLQDDLDAATAALDKLSASGSDVTSLKAAVEDAKKRVEMTARQVDGQKEELYDAQSTAMQATKDAANTNLSPTEAAAAQTALKDAIATQTLAEQILNDMIAQANRAEQLLAKRQDALDNPDSANSAIIAQQSAVDDAQAALDAAVKADDAAAAAVTKATNDVTVAQASIPTKSAAVSNAKIAQSKAVTAKTSADTAAATAKTKMNTAIATAQSAEAAAKTAGYTWTW